MQLIYEDRAEMQRSLKRAGLREVFMRCREGIVCVTALIDNRSMAMYEYAGGEAALTDEIASWRADHFEVVRGEVVLQSPGSGPGRG